MATRWTEEAICYAIRRWAEEYGEPPRQRTWQRAIPGYPSFDTVRKAFGSWNKALVAAGFPPRSRGNPGHMDPGWTMEKINA
jgi:hypothetical protein